MVEVLSQEKILVKLTEVLHTLLRHIAKNLVAAGVCDECLQVSYAIGVAKPMGIFINTFGTSKVSLSDG